ncbi:MAG: oxidoreductase [Gammaproteobacteria bacterium HGW-Gammaproteobacteria-8]|nr:MAG: oxidoreductase [Gammaproteobacteria bacterium HGW-Gammaproteobacteria-8]
MSSNIPEKFKAFRIFDDEHGYRAEIVEQGIDEQSKGDVIIRVAYSSVNYKDALAATGKGQILRSFPLNGGIDAAGTVAHSDSDRFAAGDSVLITGCGLSEVRDGGYSQYLRVPSKWLVPLPEGLSLREAMLLGTAGFTAALSLWRMQANGQTPEMGPIVVTGATGGVGSLAIDILTRAGYEAHAISGKLDRFDWLHQLGATQCVSRDELYWGEKPLESAHWAGAIDNVGGDMLAGLTRVIKPWGSIASCGMAGGIGVRTTVMPFIIRGISLLGINSAGCAYTLRETLWQRLAGEWKPAHLDRIEHAEVGLDGLPAVFGNALAGGSVGRTLVRLSDTNENKP